MALLNHVSITVSDLDRAAAFYDAAMAALGEARVMTAPDRVGYGERSSGARPETSYLSVVAGGPVAADARHWAFAAPDRAAVDAFHAAALAAGGTDDGPPGERPAYHPRYYAAFVRDPDGNRLEAVCHR